MESLSPQRKQETILGNKEADNVSICLGGWLEDWAGANIIVQCDGWKRQVHGQFYRGELARFGKEIAHLYQDLTAEATLKPIEYPIKLKLNGDGRGHVTVSGEASQRPGSDTYLTFQFEIDQRYLPRIATSLAAADPD